MTNEEFRDRVLTVVSEASKPVMTKREMFAAMAMQGILANRELQIALYADVSGGHYEGQTPETILAHEAITQADELLKQLES